MEVVEKMEGGAEEAEVERKEMVFPITVKWSGRELVVTSLTSACTVHHLKLHLFEHTRVLPHRQKLMGSGGFHGVISTVDRCSSRV